MRTIPEAIRAGLADQPALKEAVAIFRQWHGPVTDPALVYRLAMRLGFGRSPHDAAYREYAYIVARAAAGARPSFGPIGL